MYFWLCWVFVSVRGLSLVGASGGHSSSRCAGLSPLWPPLLPSTSSRRAGSVVVAHGPSCSAACGIFPDQGSNPCPLHWQADSQPLRHQGSPSPLLLSYLSFCLSLKLLHQTFVALLLSKNFFSSWSCIECFFCNCVFLFGLFSFYSVLPKKEFLNVKSVILNIRKYLHSILPLD